MRSSLLLIVGSTLFAAACGGSSGTTSGTTGTPAGTSAGASSTGGHPASTSGTTGGSTTGVAASTTGAGAGSTTGAATTTGGSTGGLAAGAACTSNAACNSDICGVNGTGFCCTAACSTTDGTCGASACSDTGACTYPSGTACGGATTCSAGILSAPGSCDGTGSCGTGTPQPCTGNFACADASTCKTTCTASTDCQTGFSCNAGACVAPADTGSCSENDDCTSGVCGLNGSGNCCSAACSTGDATCGASGCDPTGACVYPVGNTCGVDTCTAASVTTNACDATGTCSPATAACPNGYNCDATNTDCLLTCGNDTDCQTGFYCSVGVCTAQQAIGPCAANDMCTSGLCGVNGAGTNCCTAACSTGDATCGATDCDPTGACVYPGNTALCGSTAETCTGSTQQNPSACDGTGNCNDTPGTTDCTPFICGATACFSSCTDNTSCGSGDFCDVGNTACCAGIASDGTGTIAVDSVNGSDANACCGYGSAKPCATITQAMKIIDASQASNVTITATVGGAGGDWAPTGEVYPITLGWGVELSAPGVYFNDVNGNAEIFDINFYSLNDTLGYASIAGAAASNVYVGVDSTLSIQTQDPSAVQVEAGNTLYIANATLNGNPAPTTGSGTTAITVTGGATLTVGQDQLAVNTGTVTIGISAKLDGYAGIVCTTVNTSGCTINDAVLTGASSLVIKDQELVDIDAEDFANISLTSAPMIGEAPAAVGFEECATKEDGNFTSPSTAILLNGAVTMTFDNGTVSCITGDGFVLQATANGSPTLTIDSSIIENTDLGIYAKGGTATITKTAIQYNFNGVEEDSDTVLTTTGTIDLTGGGNTVACSSDIESSSGSTVPGVSVLNTTDFVLDASNTAWDTATPDTFQCDNTIANCTCEVAACTVAVNTDGMDAVYESTTTGTITTTGNTLSPLSCTAPPPPPTCDVQTQTGCPPGDRCCNSGVLGGQPYCSSGPICKG